MTGPRSLPAMTPRHGNPAVEAYAKTLERVGPSAPGRPENPRNDQCVECGRDVNLAAPVSHGLRGLHTCRTPAGVIPPYLDPVTDAERGALLEYQHRRDEQRRLKAPPPVNLDPTRPF